MRQFHSIAALSLALLVTAHGQTPEAERDMVVVTLPGPAESAAIPDKQPTWQPALDSRNGLMWKASSTHSTVYLLGSIHLGSREMYPLPEHIKEAFRQSSLLIVEVDLNKLNPATFQSLLAANGLYPRQDSLWNHVSRSTRQLVVDFCGKHGLDAEVFARMKPWLAALATMLPSTPGQQDVVPGIDKYLLDEAGNGMRVEPLESVEYQWHLMASMPEVQQERNLRSAVQNAGQGAEDFGKLQSYWLEGDAEKLNAYLTSSMREDPEYQKQVFSDRNPRMAARAEQCLKNNERCFVVVGAGHMVGKDGVVRLLRDRGYKVEQVFAQP